MDSEILKKILKDNSEKLIIMDGGKPKFVVMSYEQYRKLIKSEFTGDGFEMDFNDLMTKNGASSSVKEEGHVPMNENIGEEKKGNDLSLDDLPIT